MNEKQAAAAVQQLAVELENAQIILTPYIEADAVENDFDGEHLLYCAIKLSGWPSVKNEDNGYPDPDPYILLHPVGGLEDYDKESEAIFTTLFDRIKRTPITIALEETLPARWLNAREKAVAILREHLQENPQRFRTQLADIEAATNSLLKEWHDRKSIRVRDGMFIPYLLPLEEIVRLRWKPSFAIANKNSALEITIFDNNLQFLFPDAAIERITQAAKAAK